MTTLNAERIRLDRGGNVREGQAHAGRYFGTGDPVYRVTDDDGLDEYVRATTAKEAKAKALAARRPVPTEYHAPAELERLCAYCGLKGTQHGGADNPHRPYACPASGKCPKWPHSIKDEKRASALFDKRLASFWTKRKTAFRPVR